MLKLYVWEGFQPDYSDGLAFAIAESEAEAKEMIMQKWNRYEHDKWEKMIESEWGAVRKFDISKQAFYVKGGK